MPAKPFAMPDDPHERLRLLVVPDDQARIDYALVGAAGHLHTHAELLVSAGAFLSTLAVHAGTHDAAGEDDGGHIDGYARTVDACLRHIVERSARPAPDVLGDTLLGRGSWTGIHYGKLSLAAELCARATRRDIAAHGPHHPALAPMDRLLDIVWGTPDPDATRLHLANTAARASAALHRALDHALPTTTHRAGRILCALTTQDVTEATWRTQIYSHLLRTSMPALLRAERGEAVATHDLMPLLTAEAAR